MQRARTMEMRMFACTSLFLMLVGTTIRAAVLAARLVPTAKYEANQRHLEVNTIVETDVDDNDWPPRHILDDLIATAPQNDTRIVVAASNSDYVDFADNFAQSLLALGITNFVFVPLDEEAYRILHEAYPVHTLPLPPEQANDVVQEATFGTKEFQQLTSSRPSFLKRLLQAGYTILYNDIDMVWRSSAWANIDVMKGEQPLVDFIIWHDGPGQLCTCLIYAEPSSIPLFDQWDDEIRTGKHTTDQFAFIDLAKRLKFRFGGGTRDGKKVLKNSDEFPSGKSFPWNEPESDKRTKAVIVHNNWIMGKKEKIDRFETNGLWKPSGLLTPQPLVG